jgi:hypothetical protein
MARSWKDNTGDRPYIVTINAKVTAGQFSDSPDRFDKPLDLTIHGRWFAIPISE